MHKILHSCTKIITGIYNHNIVNQEFMPGIVTAERVAKLDDKDNLHASAMKMFALVSIFYQ